MGFDWHESLCLSQINAMILYGLGIESRLYPLTKGRSPGPISTFGCNIVVDYNSYSNYTSSHYSMSCWWIQKTNQFRFDTPFVSSSPIKSPLLLAQSLSIICQFLLRSPSNQWWPGIHTDQWCVGEDTGLQSSLAARTEFDLRVCFYWRSVEDVRFDRFPRLICKLDDNL